MLAAVDGVEQPLKAAPASAANAVEPSSALRVFFTAGDASSAGDGAAADPGDELKPANAEKPMKPAVDGAAPLHEQMEARVCQQSGINDSSAPSHNVL